MVSGIAARVVTAVVGVAAAGLVSAAVAAAEPQVVPYGQPAHISAASGTQDIEYTVDEVQPSGHDDGIWYAQVTAKGVRGSSKPIIAEFNARAADGSTYPAIRGKQPDGLPNGRIVAGSEVAGKVFFDVRDGSPPDSVVYRNGSGADLVVWKG